MYYFGIWSAGDAKYLLVLALFIPNTGIIPLIGNIALLTLIYLFLYFLYFYFGKCLFNWKYAKSLYENIYMDLKEKSVAFLKHGDGNFYKNVIFLKLLKWILLFLIFFVSIRLSRLYIFVYIKESSYYLQAIEYLQNYTSYILLALIGVSIGVIYGIRILINKLKESLKQETRIKNDTTLDFALIGLLFVVLIGFIVYEYRMNPSEIHLYLIRIFTLYIGIYIIFKILQYSYKITFQLAEQDFIDIKNLKAGDIVDKEYLAKIFGEQSPLGFCLDNASIKEITQKRRKLLYPNPKEYFTHMSNPIDNETKRMLVKIYKITNVHHKKEKTPHFNEITTIKILKTFAFGGYIFLGFLITYFLGDQIIGNITSIIMEYLKTFYN
ncbi:MAG: hypothetical protein PHQ95_04110 [Candidatus Gracilibacteria bacterium]|nr:hypothetical protein [Candidatus Gracilibacteria bacterium]